MDGVTTATALPRDATDEEGSAVEHRVVATERFSSKAWKHTCSCGKQFLWPWKKTNLQCPLENYAHLEALWKERGAI